mgnify:CR=1 FL=1
MKIKELSESLDQSQRSSIQTGTVGKSLAFKLRGLIKKLIRKHATGDDWEIKKHSADLGLYYNGQDLASAKATGFEILGDLYDLFQLGKAREITRTKKVEDTPERVTYEVIPTHEPGQKGKAPQISFTFNKQAQQGDAVIGILIQPDWDA